MEIGTLKVPCGCKERKEIMFDQGQPGRTEAIIVGVVSVALVASIIYAVTR